MNGREAAFEVLFDGEQNGAFVNAATSKMFDSESLDEKEKSLASALVAGVLKNRLKLDYIIGQFSKTKLRKISPKVLIILRLGTYQILFMDKIPDSAACNESVKLVKKFFSPKSTGFVNGILRNISRNKDNIKYPKKEDFEDFLSVEYSFPKWLCKKLVLQYGKSAAEEFMKNSNEPHGVYIRPNKLKTTVDDLLEMFEKKDICAKPCENEMVYVCSSVNLLSIEEYKKGLFSIQNISSKKAVDALSPKSGEVVVDICAAPGGKSCAVAEKMNNSGKIYSFDIYEHKIKLIKKSAERLGISIIDARVLNGENPDESIYEKADRVLLDAPCSGIGVIHKKPDIKWMRKPEDVEEISKIQKNLLSASKNYLKPGGILVYSTCTVLKEENEDNINNFLSDNPNFEKVFEEKILTSKAGESGFYICKLKKFEQ